MGERKSPAVRRRRTRLRNFALLLALIAVGALLDPGIVSPFGPIAAPPERIGASFVRCGTPGNHPACVVDGDTFRLGSRRVRIVGIDAPELVSPKCDGERQLAGRAADRLTLLLNEAPFDMVAHRFRPRDRHGRDLRDLYRGDADMGDVLIAEGLAHRYWGIKTGWC